MVEPWGGKQLWNGGAAWGESGSGNLAQLLRRVGASLHAGLDPRSTWEKEAEYGSAVHRSMMSRVSQTITDGGSLADGLAACGGYFPPLVCTLIEVGEKSGRLDDILRGLAEHYEHLLALRRTFLVGIAWPAIQLFAAIGIVGLLILVLGIVSSMTGTEVDPLGFGLVGTPGLLIYLGLVVPTFGGIAGPGDGVVARRVRARSVANRHADCPCWAIASRRRPCRVSPGRWG